MANFPYFLRAPDGCSYNVHRIGGVKAPASGYVLLGTGANELLCYVETSPKVAIAWRDATVEVLANHRPDRQLPQIDWAGLAIEADPDWAAENGWSAEAGSASSARPAPQPRRRAAEGGEA